MKQFICSLLVSATVLYATPSLAAVEKYIIDVKGAHAFIQFKIKHLGVSWLIGRFNTFDGDFTIDRNNLNNSSISVTIDTASIDSNHAERDKHLRGSDFLDVKTHPTAIFKSTSISTINDENATITGNLTLHGVTKPITIDAQLIGEGKDPWGGYRIGFAGNTTLTLADFGITYNLGPASKEVEMELFIEGIRQ